MSQQELQTDSQRNQVRAAVVAAWGAQSSSVGVVRAARAAVSANEVALAGVREEAKVGQRTTLDVLNAQQALLNARVQLVSAEHDEVVNSYSLLSAVGRLNIRPLASRSPNTIRACISTRSRTSGSASGRPADSELQGLRGRLPRAAASDYRSAERRAIRPSFDQASVCRLSAAMQGA